MGRSSKDTTLSRAVMWMPTHSDQFHAHSASRSGQRVVSCDKRGIERFSKGHVSCVIGRQTVPHLPDAGEQDEMWVAVERKIVEISESFGTAFRRDGPGPHIAAQYLRDFKVDKMRSMQGLVGSEDHAIHTASRGRLEQNLEDGGSIDDDQRLFLSARTAAAGAGCGRTGCRRESRFRISSRVGRSSACRSSRSR
jgi:hypothetical protein